MKQLLILFIFLYIGLWVQAAIINVTTTQDNVPGSLRAAITQANTNGEDNIIFLPGGKMSKKFITIKILSKFGKGTTCNIRWGRN